MPGFDPDQPRDEKGQWTDSGGSSAIKNAASDKMKMAALRVDEIKNDFRRLGETQSESLVWGGTETIENAKSQRRTIMYGLDDKLNELGLNVFEKMDIVEDMIRYQPFESLAVYDSKGNMAFFDDGSEKSVSISGTLRESAKGGYFTHNHPKDQSFSNGDLNTAVSFGFKEMRAASAGHDYVFTPNYNYKTDATDDPVYANQDAMQDIVWDEAKQMQKRIVSGEINQDEASESFQHNIFLRFAKRTGGKYSFEPKDISNVPDKKLLKPDPYESIFGEEAIANERRRNRMVAADDVNIQMRRLQKNLKKNF